MPVDVQIDRDRHLIRATFVGAISKDEMRAYLVDTWVGDEFHGFRELADVRQLVTGELPFAELMGLAQVAPRTVTTPRASRVALVCSSDQVMRAEFFGAARNVLRTRTGEFEIFYSLEEAETWLTRSEEE